MLSFIKKINIRKKIFLSLFFCSTIPMVILSVVIINQNIDATKTNAELAQSYVDSTLYDIIYNEVKYLDNVSYNVHEYYLYMDELINGSTDIRPQSSILLSEILVDYSLTQQNHRLISIYFYDANYNLLDYDFYNRPLGFDLEQQTIPSQLDRYLTQQNSREKQLFVVYDENYNREVVKYFYPIVHRNVLMGHFCYNIELDYFQELMEEHNRFDNGNIQLVMTENNTVVYSTDGDGVGATFDDKVGFYDRMVSTDIQGIGIKIYYTYTISPQMILSYYVAIFAPIVALLLLIVISIVFSWNITTPIILLSESVKKVSYGDYDVHVNITSQDEIGDLATSFNAMTRRIRDYIHIEMQYKLDLKTEQIHTMQAQINPHFLHNTLQTISNLAVTGTAEDVGFVCKVLSDVYTTIRQEIVNVRNYMIIISKCFQNDIDFKVKNAFDILDLYVPKFILQPIVENAVLHGLQGYKDVPVKMLMVLFEVSQDELIIKIEDNGRGIPKSEVDKINCKLQGKGQTNFRNDSCSIGIHNVQQRIRMLQGVDYGLTISSEHSVGTSVSFKLKLLNVLPPDNSGDPDR